MKISGKQVPGAIQSFMRQVGPAGKRDEKVAAAAADKVNLSPAAENLAAVKKAALAQADIRAEKVQALKTAIGKGEYRVSAAEVAARIVDEYKK